MKNNYTAAELRLQNDLLDFKKHRMSTKMFDSQISDIVTDQDKKMFQIKIFISPLTDELIKFTREVNIKFI
jgi:hypothetical protein